MQEPLVEHAKKTDNEPTGREFGQVPGGRTALTASGIASTFNGYAQQAHKNPIGYRGGPA